MDLLTWLAVGFLAGLLASFIVGGAGFGLIGDILIGILGAVLGGWLAALLDVSASFAGLGGGLIIAFIGSVVLLLALRAMQERPPVRKRSR
ncbi:MAG: GlsB/YeaQ/YmgE family stress response membrane protein [Gemmatimonadales bacterium]|nr:GlsB/YeaQ/YmgE family stress response membrane protein [Gemmatimonadales bacterium]